MELLRGIRPPKAPWNLGGSNARLQFHMGGWYYYIVDFFPPPPDMLTLHIPVFFLIKRPQLVAIRLQQCSLRIFPPSATISPLSSKASTSFMRHSPLEPYGAE